MATTASWSDRMEAEDDDDELNFPLKFNLNSGTDWLSGIRMKKNEGKRCAQIREFEAEINNCSSQIKNAQSVVQQLPEDAPKDAYHRL
ncbi:hypothetical protein AVEN_70413-1 [Araneus ventricosus]|uniref:Uncharacterized protein n=1 Tax=Araneus ventricosus TaxID=182803 RepID=A0A4Y2QKE5_ARAVE|nr:hypothetical protein AVEN_70413-1 [Araneus ventricosus]